MRSSFWVLDLSAQVWCKSVADCPPLRGGVNAVCTVPVRRPAPPPLPPTQQPQPPPPPTQQQQRVFLYGGMNSDEGTNHIG